MKINMKIKIAVIIVSMLILITSSVSCRNFSKPVLLSDGGVGMIAEYQLVHKPVVKTISILEDGSSVDLSILMAKAFVDARDLLSEDNGSPVKVIIQLEKDKTYYFSKPIVVDSLHDVEIDGNGAKLINTVRGSAFQISNSIRVTIRNVSIDYDPLPFTQGIIVSMNETTTQIDVKVDKGYPMDLPFLFGIKSGFFTVADRQTKALKEGARTFVAPTRAEKLTDDTIRVFLAWPLNECGNGQVPAAIGDVIVLRAQLIDAAISVKDCAYTSLIGMNIYTSPGMGILEDGGFGGLAILNCNLVPGTKPEGASEDRLSSTNSDGSHFITVQQGPLIKGSRFHNTSDDCINVHGFYYYVLSRTSENSYYISPQWDIGLEPGDTIQALDKENFDSMGTAKVLSVKKHNMPELADDIRIIWSGKSPTTKPELVYEIELSEDLDLSTGDAITSLSRIGENTMIIDNEFKACGRVICTGPNTTITDNKFSYSNYCALHVGSDIGFWATSNFADGATIINNTFDHCNVGANTLFDGEVNATLFVSMTAPFGTVGFFENTMNKKILIENNIIRDSYTYGLVITNAEDVIVKNNTIDQVFIRDDSFNVGVNYGVVPDSGIFAAMVKNIQFSGNKVYSRTIATRAITVVDSDSMIGSVAFDGNVFESK